MFCECPCHQSYHEYYVKKFRIRRKLTITRNGAVHIPIIRPISALISKKEILISDVVGKGHVISYLITKDRMCNLQDHQFYLANQY